MAIDDLTDTFNVDFNSCIEDVNKQMEVVDKRKNEITNTLKETKIGFSEEDKIFLLSETKSLIQITNSALNKLDQDLRIGASGKMYEAMANLINSKSSALKELRELYKMILEMKMFHDEESGSSKAKNDEVKMTATDFLKIVKEAQKSNSLDAVEANYSVVDEREDPDSNNFTSSDKNYKRKKHEN